MRKMLVKIILITLGTIISALFLIPSLLTRNFHIGALTGGGIGMVLILYGIFMTPVNRFLLFLWRHIPGKCLLGLLAACIAAILVLAILCIISMASTASRLPDVRRAEIVQSPDAGSSQTSDSAQAADHAQTQDSGQSLGLTQSAASAESTGTDTSLTVIVLGCHVYSYGPSRLLAARLDTAADYLLAHPDSDCIVCGGQANNDPVTEASVMFSYLVDKGISPDRIYLDDTSLDTAENFANAASIIESEGLNSDVVVVTNDFHMYRALTLAEKNKLAEPKALPAPTLWWLFCPFTVREMYGILEMWFL